jgi:hypothetical protein
MHKLITLAALAAIATSASATDVGVSVQISQPGVYGRIDLGRFPQPAVVVAQPVLVAQPQVAVAQPVQPVYMWVPQGHRKNWHKHCHEYGACGVPVYFVRHDWYERNVVVAGNGYSGEEHGKGHGKGHGKNKD